MNYCVLLLSTVYSSWLVRHMHGLVDTILYYRSNVKCKVQYTQSKPTTNSVLTTASGVTNRTAHYAFQNTQNSVLKFSWSCPKFPENWLIDLSRRKKSQAQNHAGSVCHSSHVIYINRVCHAVTIDQSFWGISHAVYYLACAGWLAS